jgi:hypothetical protein
MDGGSLVDPWGVDSSSMIDPIGSFIDPECK